MTPSKKPIIVGPIHVGDLRDKINRIIKRHALDVRLEDGSFHHRGEGTVRLSFMRPTECWQDEVRIYLDDNDSFMPIDSSVTQMRLDWEGSTTMDLDPVARLMLILGAQLSTHDQKGQIRG